MRCNICDKALTENEINWNKEIDAFDPCSTCLEIALEAAFGQGYHDDDEEYVPVLDDDDYFTSYVDPYEVGNYFGFDGGWDD